MPHLCAMLSLQSILAPAMAFYGCLALFLVTVTTGLASNIPVVNIHNFYKDVGCAPVLEDGVVTHYDCSNFEKRDVKKCYDGSQVYAVDEKIDGVRPHSCLAECKCINSGESSAFNCAHVECPEFFRGLRPENERLIYEDGKCCSSNSTTIQPEQAEVTCRYNNRTYIGGEKFYPTDEDAPCSVCICKANFEGKLEEPFCTPIQCHVQLNSALYLNDGCVPTYFKDTGCCPIEWRCPADTDAVVGSRSVSVNKCKFGKLTLNIDEQLNSSSPKDICTCTTPPYVTCIKSQ